LRAVVGRVDVPPGPIGNRSGMVIRHFESGRIVAPQ